MAVFFHRKGDEESDIFFNVTAVNGQDGIENVFLLNGETDECGLDDESNDILFLG
jgi:hypothetical protein